MRCKQLSALLTMFDENIQTVAIPAEDYSGKPEVVVAHKSIFTERHLEKKLRKLRRNGTQVFVDLVDGHPNLVTKFWSTKATFLCASPAEYDFRVALGQRAALIPHHVDARVEVANHPHSSFDLGYVGSRRNLMHPQLEGLAIIEPVSGSELSIGGHHRNALESFSHHYTVRKLNKMDGFKPPLKVYLAAHMGAVAISSADDPEALSVLGDEYPYLSPDSSAKSVEQTIQFARKTFNQDEHHRARKVMDSLRSEFCSASVISLLHLEVSADMRVNTSVNPI